MENALVHRIGDVKTLTKHITVLHEDRSLLQRLRTASLATASEATWAAAGRELLDALPRGYQLKSENYLRTQNKYGGFADVLQNRLSREPMPKLSKNARIFVAGHVVGGRGHPRRLQQEGYTNLQTATRHQA